MLKRFTSIIQPGDDISLKLYFGVQGEKIIPCSCTNNISAEMSVLFAVYPKNISMCCKPQFDELLKLLPHQPDIFKISWSGKYPSRDRRLFDSVDFMFQIRWPKFIHLDFPGGLDLFQKNFYADQIIFNDSDSFDELFESAIQILWKENVKKIIFADASPDQICNKLSKYNFNQSLESVENLAGLYSILLTRSTIEMFNKQTIVAVEIGYDYNNLQ